MNELEKQLLREEVGDAEPRLCIRSGTRIDAGRWWRGTPVWLCIVGDELILLAVARRRFIVRRALAACQASHYSHISGELVILPADELQFNRLAFSPRNALRILSILNHNHHPLHIDQ